MAEQKANVSAEKKTEAAPKKGPVDERPVVSNTDLTLEEAEKIREEGLAEKAEEGKEWSPLAGTGGGLHTDTVVIHNPDIYAPVVVKKGQPVRFESEGYKLREAPDPGA
jgi:hypothetical protein